MPYLFTHFEYYSIAGMAYLDAKKIQFHNKDLINSLIFSDKF